MVLPTSSDKDRLIMESKAENHEGRDFLTCLPEELLVKIIARMPSYTYFDLVHTCKFFRQFLKTDGRLICNEAIRTRYALESELLETTLEPGKGWLVPTHASVKAEEKEILKERRLFTYRDRKYFTILGEAKRKEDVPVSLMKGGPQYLYFLEQGFIHVLTEPEISELEKKLNKSTREGLIKGVLEGKVCHFSIWSDWHGRQRYKGFLEDIGKRILYVEGGKPVLPLYDSKWKLFPRQLVWYHGVDKLFERDGVDEGVTDAVMEMRA